MKKFLHIRTEYEPKITGVSNGVYAIEIKNRHSFACEEDRKIWNNNIKEVINDYDRRLFKKFTPFDVQSMSQIPLYFRAGKRMKPLDFIMGMDFQPLDFTITQRVYYILSEFHLPIHNKVPIKIEGIEQPYFLFSIPMMAGQSIDFQRSKYYNTDTGEATFTDWEDYRQYRSGLTFPVEIYLHETSPYDVIRIPSGFFISEKIAERFEQENITGYRILSGELFVEN